MEGNNIYIKNMVCRRCILTVSNIFQENGITPASVGNGLLAIAAHQGIRIEETMALGDGGNDIPIVERAGIGVAMGNANDSLKAIADYVTDSVDENGVYHALKHWVF